MYAVRQMTMGLSTWTMWYTGSYQAMGLCSLAGCAVAVMDAFVSKDVTGQYVMGHWAALPVSVFMGTALLGWL